MCRPAATQPGTRGRGPAREGACVERPVRQQHERTPPPTHPPAPPHLRRLVPVVAVELGHLGHQPAADAAQAAAEADYVAGAAWWAVSGAVRVPGTPAGRRCWARRPPTCRGSRQSIFPPAPRHRARTAPPSCRGCGRRRRRRRWPGSPRPGPRRVENLTRGPSGGYHAAAETVFQMTRSIPRQRRLRECQRQHTTRTDAMGTGNRAEKL